MIVIIEGTDLVGKSTLAERLTQAHGWPIVKIRWALVGDAKAETVDMANATIELLAATTPDVILDRSYFSCGPTARSPPTCQSSSRGLTSSAASRRRGSWC